jgi:branched-chain amino acid transport system permease protein
MLQATIYGALILLIGRFMPGGLLRAPLLRAIPGVRRLGLEHHERVAVNLPPPVRGIETLPLERRVPNRDTVVLDCRGLSMAFGGNVAVNNVDLQIREGEIVGLVGANGSGKTTLFNCISKVYEPIGDIAVAGRSLKGLRRDQVSRLGVGRTYQIPRPFNDLTVQENIAMPLMFRDETMDVRTALAEAAGFAAYAGLSDRLAARADALTLQQKKALEFARALACRPRILLVDEVASGLTEAEVRRFVQHIREVRDTYGITVIWVEHIFSALAQVADRIVVLEQGTIIADGPLREVVRDERVLRTYLGSAAVGVA